MQTLISREAGVARTLPAHPSDEQVLALLPFAATIVRGGLAVAVAELRLAAGARRAVDPIDLVPRILLT